MCNVSEIRRPRSEYQRQKYFISIENEYADTRQYIVHRKFLVVCGWKQGLNESDRRYLQPTIT